MNPDLEVDTDELRRAASTLAGTAAEVTAGTSEMPAAQRTPRWRTADAAALAGDAAHRQLALLGGDIDETARRIATAAEAYEVADARAAARLRSSR
ncbi:type VII secretion target [Paractinoplanes durhamensis]|uniref:type VII secretion target n=1 Tax=Paractinoplanes durhamensis TaxID=113563 RepID=UPI0031DDF3ED